MGIQTGEHPEVAFVFHEAMLRHDTGRGHPESFLRLEAILDYLDSQLLFRELDIVKPAPAAPQELEGIHPKSHIEAIGKACAGGVPALDPDTRIGPDSYRAALLAAGAALQAVDLVESGRVRSAFCAVRPPGHHAERARAMGFCLFNNAALAALHLRSRHGKERVLVVDFDVHHGNGTQHLFEEDPSVYYMSVHQWPLFPGTGAAGERGRGAGLGTTLNVPLAPGHGDSDYERVFLDAFGPEVRRFRPEGIVVSAGFDPHVDDPLAGMEVTEEGFYGITRIIRHWADEFCGGRLVSLLEGGYDLTALARSTEAHLRALMD